MAILTSFALSLVSVAVPFASRLAPPTSDLRFDPAKYQARQAQLNGKALAYRAFEGIVYVKRPVDTKYQTINIYVPEAYYHGQSINGYTAKTAPIFFPNSIGGYMPGAAQQPGAGMDGMHNTLLSALAHGYVVAAPGARGRTLKANGRYTGKAPAAIVDLKAAVRYVKFNRGRFPGNVDRIVSNGTSAGGAMSALLGGTGNNRDYVPYLKALGAAETSDDVWAVSAYCPITNLDNADMAYEWLLNGVNASHNFGGGMPPNMKPGGAPPAGPPAGAGRPGMGGANPFGQPSSHSGNMDATQIANSAALKAMFPAYVNSLRLRDPKGKPLTLDKSGNGSFKDFVTAQLLRSAVVAQRSGVDLSKTSWVTLRNGTPVAIDFNGFATKVGRMKQTSAFDSTALTTGENNLFGTDTVDNQHFTAFGMAHNTAKGATLANPGIVKMMNPMAYIGRRGTTTTKFWRIRHGAIDRDTSVAIPAILATKLRNVGCEVDLAIPWNTPHSGDYDIEQLFVWIDRHAQRP